MHTVYGLCTSIHMANKNIQFVALMTYAVSTCNSKQRKLVLVRQIHEAFRYFKLMSKSGDFCAYGKVKDRQTDRINLSLPGA